jgi:hypothetical protein
MLATIEEIKKQGFVGFKSVEDIRENSGTIPKSKGVYVVLHPNYQKVDFLDIGTGGFFKGKNPNVTLEDLKNNWVMNSHLIYIGQAGGNGSANTLNKRIRQYINFGNGKNVGHYGGRFIWQIKDNHQLIFAWKEVPNDNPSVIEKQLLMDYINHYRMFPFANLKM